MPLGARGHTRATDVPPRRVLTRASDHARATLAMRMTADTPEDAVRTNFREIAKRLGSEDAAVRVAYSRPELLLTTDGLTLQRKLYRLSEVAASVPQWKRVASREWAAGEGDIDVLLTRCSARIERCARVAEAYGACDVGHSMLAICQMDEDDFASAYPLAAAPARAEAK